MSSAMYVVFTIGAIMMAILAAIIRLKATKRPATVKKIVLPPLFMSTGFLMFLYPPVRPGGTVEIIETFIALAVGMIFSIFLIKSSKFEIKEDQIYLKRSKAFIFILFGLLLCRIALKLIIGDTVSYEVLSGMFFILAYGMIIPWRISMFISYKKLEKELERTSNEKQVVPAQT
ncbi:CcdC family protein [Desertibacillus haloalkaliphilus]|uniref:CcdC family protein n=1 Tax=Desertibacillus haloalkaliphilus TaxID=1328930 RepID=UPI001C270491|nr:cytochrome c biogenesis protein CcdC [Desertibacillus haloalkaliphilus]MBU8907397.1 cytochrome c biogenesis protein CcdC [Desertibacillus haloalkaliphilus]